MNTRRISVAMAGTSAMMFLALNAPGQPDGYKDEREAMVENQVVARFPGPAAQEWRQDGDSGGIQVRHPVSSAGGEKREGGCKYAEPDAGALCAPDKSEGGGVVQKAIALMMLWDRTQLLNFGGYYLLLCLPFFFGGYIIGNFFMAREIAPRHVYFANMLGSGVGILLALLLLVDIHPAHALGIAVVPLAATAWPVFEKGFHRILLIATLLLAGMSVLRVGQQPSISQYKGMSAGVLCYGLAAIAFPPPPKLE